MNQFVILEQTMDWLDYLLAALVPVTIILTILAIVIPCWIFNKRFKEKVGRLANQVGLSPLSLHNLLHDQRRLGEIRQMGKNEDAILEYLRRVRAWEEPPPMPGPAFQPESSLPATHTKEVIERQVVVVCCQFCGNLYPAVQLKCPKCGGK